MAFDIKAWTFSKRKNSTLQPPAADAVEISVVLKEETSYNNPVFLLRYDGDFPYNYFAWGTWYYFLVDVRSVRNNLYEVECVLDPLATYKAEILASSAFVLYSGNLGNSNIVDTRLSIREVPTIGFNGFFTTFLSASNLTAVVSVVGKDGCGSYAMSVSQAAELMSTIDDWTDVQFPEIESWEDIPDVLAEVGNVINRGFAKLTGSGQAPNAIRSAMIVPFDSSYIVGVGGQEIYLGTFPTGKRGTRITQRVQTVNFSVGIPWQATGWERNEPYHYVYLYLPMIGLIHIPASSILTQTSLDIKAVFDTAGGTLDYTVMTSTSKHYIGHYATNVGSPLAIGASNYTPMQALTSAAGGAAAGAAMGIAAASGGAALVAAGAASILGCLNNSSPLNNCIGTNGGLSGIETEGACFTIYSKAATPVSGVIGSPTMAAVQLGTVSGYCQTRAASVAVSAPDGIRQEINSLLDSGIFIE